MEEPDQGADYQGDEYGFRRSELTDFFTGGRPHSERILDAVERFRVPGDLLDVGCATGELLMVAQSRGWRVTGVEMSPYAVAVARGAGLTVHQGTTKEAQLPRESFDAVTLLDVIEHLESPVDELKRLHGLLRPGGVLLVETPNWNSVYRRLLGRWWAALQPRLHLLYLDPDSGRRILAAAGFEPVKVSTETVALLSPEGRARGLGTSSVAMLLRHAAVAWRLHRPLGPLDEAMLAVGPARGGSADTSFKAMAGGSERSRANGRQHLLTRRLNRPLDSFFLKRNMGEQLRLVGIRR